MVEKDRMGKTAKEVETWFHTIKQQEEKKQKKKKAMQLKKTFAIMNDV